MIEKKAISLGKIMDALISRSNSPRIFSGAKNLVRSEAENVLKKIPNPYTIPARTYIDDITELITKTQQNSFPIQESRILGLHMPPWIVKTGTLLNARTMRAAANLRAEKMDKEWRSGPKNKNVTGQAAGSFSKFIKKEKDRAEWNGPINDKEIKDKLNNVFKSSYDRRER